MKNEALEKFLINRKQKLAATKNIKAKYPNDKQVQIVSAATIADLEWTIKFWECEGNPVSDTESGLHKHGVNGCAKSELVKLIEDSYDYALEKKPGYGGYLYENAKELVSDMETDLDEFISKHCR